MKTLCCLLTLVSISFPSFSAEPQSLNELMEKWIKIESQKGELQLDWNSRKQQLTQTVKLLSTERDELKQLLKKADTDKSDVDSRRIELSKKQNLLEKEQVLVK